MTFGYKLKFPDGSVVKDDGAVINAVSSYFDYSIPDVVQVLQTKSLSQEMVQTAIDFLFKQNESVMIHSIVVSILEGTSVRQAIVEGVQITEVKNIFESTSNLYLYHATALENKDSILSDGLLINSKNHNWDNMYCDGKIFLALNAECAEDYVYSAENAPDDIVMFKVSLQDLNPAYIGYDWNNRCEYHTDINSIVYTANIPANKLTLVTSISSEPDQDIDSFEGTDLYDIVLDTFDNECETNLEIDDMD